MLIFFKNLERVDGIEPTSSAWKAAALPLCYTRAETAEVLSERRSRFLSVVLIRRIRQGAWWGKKDSNLRSLRRGFTVPPLCRSGHSPSAPCRTVGPLVSAHKEAGRNKSLRLVASSRIEGAPRPESPWGSKSEGVLLCRRNQNATTVIAVKNRSSETVPTAPATRVKSPLRKGLAGARKPLVSPVRPIGASRTPIIFCGGATRFWPLWRIPPVAAWVVCWPRPSAPPKSRTMLSQTATGSRWSISRP